MRTQTGLVAVMMISAVVGFAGTGAALTTEVEMAAEPYVDLEDVYRTLPPELTTTLSTMGAGPCAIALKALTEQDLASVPEDRDELGFEHDPLTGECRDLRDALEHKVWDGEDPPFIQYCRGLYGQNCVAIGHYACDFGIIIGSGLVYYCMGGLTPYN